MQCGDGSNRRTCPSRHNRTPQNARRTTPASPASTRRSSTTSHTLGLRTTWPHSVYGEADDRPHRCRPTWQDRLTPRARTPPLHPTRALRGGRSLRSAAPRGGPRDWSEVMTGPALVGPRCCSPGRSTAGFAGRRWRGAESWLSRAAGHSHVIRFDRRSALGAVVADSLLDAASHGPGGGACSSPTVMAFQHGLSRRGGPERETRNYYNGEYALDCCQAGLDNFHDAIPL